MNRMLLGYVGLLSMVCGCVSAPKAPVRSMASEEAREFHIAAADLPAALSEFSKQANVQLLFDYAAVRERSTVGVEGVLPPSQALKSLLTNTGLVADNINDSTVAIRPDKASRSRAL